MICLSINCLLSGNILKSKKKAMERYRQIVGTLNWFLFLVVAFTLSFSPAILRVVWTIWLISWFLELRFLDKKNFTFSKYQIPAFIFLVYFIWQCVSFLWTIDRVTAGVVLERQVSFFFLPIVMMFGVNGNYDIKKSIFSFILGSAIISIFYIVSVFVLSNYSSILKSGYSQFLENIRFDLFFKYFPSYFGHIRHHAFFSNVLIIASIFLIFIYNDIRNLVGKKTAFVLTFLYLTINSLFFVYLTDSRGSIVAILVVMFVGTLRFFYKKKKWIILSLSTIVVTVSIISFFYFHPRMKEINLDRLINLEQVENNDDARLKIWSTALRHVDEYLFVGKGVGSSKSFLEQKNKEDNIFDEKFIERRFHSHNQYIETTIELGLFALILFVSAFVLQVYFSKQRIKQVGLFVTIALAVKCLFDSIFRSDDVVILLCFICLIVYWSNTYKPQKNM